ncbi:helix-turn-helix transcriptional regulator [Kitasatospora sp. NPDC028055]|uniref:helix-turn-helix domain-containing protein n=1 Tax=Kitasatospora sp. NPDC028055 TaxID=3155653 RepID=UPI00340EB987
MREADEVARLLQELKSRSGLSYGALAKRLHVSTSALHRYCNGDVMPGEFTPLERLARLCRATPEERTELYRLWVAAHAARGGRQSSVPAPAANAPSAAPATAPAVAPSTVPSAAPVTATAAEGIAPDWTAALAHTPAEPRRRVRRSVLAAVTAAAVLATVGAVAAGLRTRTAGDPASGPAPAAEAGATTGATTSGPAGAPVTVVVRPSGWDAECDQYVVDRPPAEVPRPPAPADVPAWVSEVGAVPGHYQSIELVVQGTGDDTVVLTALDVRVARTAAPLAWNAYAMGEGCGGGVDVHSYDLDLDAARPRPVVTEGRTGLPVTVSERDPQVIEVSAETTAHDVSWYLELEWSSGNRKGTLTIGPGGGAPFRTSAVKGRPLYSYPVGGKAWEPSAFQQ